MNRRPPYRAGRIAPVASSCQGNTELQGAQISQDFEPRFAVALERRGERTVVRASGELDVETAPQLERALAAVQSPGRYVLLDLRDVRAADDNGLRTILHALDAADDAGTDLRLIPGELARRMFRSAGLAWRLAAVTADDGA
jgi:anti-sigma B factor antagonist